MIKQSWNENWFYYPENKPETKVQIMLPHDAMIHEKRSADCANSYNSGYYPGGKYIYENGSSEPDEKSQNFIDELQ